MLVTSGNKSVEKKIENIRKQLVHTSFLFPKMQKRPWVLNALSNWIEQLKHLGSEHLSCSPNFPHASYLDERSWRMNQLLISVHLIQEVLFSFSLFPSILVKIVFCFEISQAFFLSFLFSFFRFHYEETLWFLTNFEYCAFFMIQLSIMTFVPRAFKTYGRFSKTLHLWKQESIHISFLF